MKTTTNSPAAQPQEGELLPCPFCGSVAGDIKLSRGHGYIIGCGSCQGQQFALKRDEAVRLWNTRADLPRATADAIDKELIEAVAAPWICVEERPCEETVAVHWDELITALTAAINRAPPHAIAANDALHPENYCHKCGGPNVVWFALNRVWDKAVREAGEPGILCPTCFIQLAEAAGFYGVWKVALHDSLSPRATGETTIEDALAEVCEIFPGVPKDRISWKPQ